MPPKKGKLTYSVPNFTVNIFINIEKSRKNNIFVQFEFQKQILGKQHLHICIVHDYETFFFIDLK